MFLCEQPNLVEKLIVEDISPSFYVSEGFPECIAAMKSISFRPVLKNIVRARKFASEQLREVIPVSCYLLHHVLYVCECMHSGPKTGPLHLVVYVFNTPE